MWDKMVQERVCETRRLLGGSEIEAVCHLAERLDFLDVMILKKFYVTGKEFPNDIRPYCFPLLYKEMKQLHRVKIGVEGLRKRLNNLVKLGLLEKVKNSNPSAYIPVRGKENFVRAVITKFFLISGMVQYADVFKK